MTARELELSEGCEGMTLARISHRPSQQANGHSRNGFPKGYRRLSPLKWGLPGRNRPLNSDQTILRAF